MNNPFLKKIYKEKYLVALLLSIIAGFYIYMAYASKGVYGGGDTYMHYAFSHYAFRHPHLFLDHWGKPLFTAFSSPFSQFGFIGLQWFNIIISLFSAFIAWRLCKHFQLRFSWMSFLIICFAPMYFIIAFSGLTENLFSLVLIASVFLFFKEKYWWTAIILSFLPFARTEGFVIIPLFAMALALRQRWFAIAGLAFGFVFYGIIGFIYFHNFFWFILNNPYKDAASIYGHGSIWHFVVNYREIFGAESTFLILLGCFSFFFPFGDKKLNWKISVSELLLIFFPVLIYFAAHSYAWWQGIGGSLGLTRVIAGIIPLAAVIGIKGINMLFPWFHKYRTGFFVILSLLCCSIIIEPLRFHSIPSKNGGEETVLDQTAQWFIKNNHEQKKIILGNPYLFFKIDTDPFDEKSINMVFPTGENLRGWTTPGEFLVWDAHFTPNEGHLPLKDLMDNKYFELKSYFKPEESFTTLGGGPYEVYVFQRTDDTSHVKNSIIMQQMAENNYDRKVIFNDNYSNSGITVDATSTENCLKVNSDKEFSPGMDILIRNVTLEKESHIELSAEVYIDRNPSDAQLEFVSSVFNEKNTYFYKSFPIDISKLKTNFWNHLTFDFVLPKIQDDKAHFNAYLWNRNKSEFYIDNFMVTELKAKE